MEPLGQWGSDSQCQKLGYYDVTLVTAVKALQYNLLAEPANRLGMSQTL
jgi:hypothetical protein